MALTTVITCVLCTIYWYKKENNTINPGFILSALWALISLLAYMELYDLKKTSSYTYAIIVVGILSYTIGCIISKRKTIKIKIGSIISMKLKIIMKF